jgi:CHAD domain-containing protein
VLLAQLVLVRRLLNSPPVPADSSIHEARKGLKRARAALRLLRPSIGERQYRVANTALRNAAVPLSAVRDGKILLEILRALTQHAAPASRVPAIAVHRLLLRERRRARAAMLRNDIGLALSARTVTGVSQAVKRCPWVNGEPQAAGDAVKHNYRKLCLAFATAKGRPSDGNLHEWRKQTKYTLHELQLLFVKKSKYIVKLIHRLHRLAERLGDDHDLAVLRHKVRQNRGTLGPSATFRPLIDSIEHRRAALQSAAWAEGRRICAQTPKHLLRQLA